MTKILGFQSGHDVSYCVLENGIPIIHEELERFIRKKEPIGDGLKMAMEYLPDDVLNEITHFTLGNWGMHQSLGISKWGNPGTGVSYNMGCYDKELVQKMETIADNNGGIFMEVSHHLSHASNAFFTSNFEESLIVTMDGGGIEEGWNSTAFAIFYGKGNDITPLEIFGIKSPNFGVMWNAITSKVMRLKTGFPTGNQCGSVMAMASAGNPIYKHLFNINPSFIDFSELEKIANTSEEEKFNVASSLQKFTEESVFELISPYIISTGAKNICFSGGVSLNCVLVGKIKRNFSSIQKVFVDPVPYDSGLCLGSARHLWHSVLKNPRIYNNPRNRTSYLGRKYSNKQELLSYVKSVDGIYYEDSDDSKVIDMLDKQQIVSVFGGSSESGRRALGNRSILADPRNENMRDIINQKVKHRQWYRPFAPSILRENVSEWFEEDVDSPYMSFAIKFKNEKAKEVPAVVHIDGTGRLQTVTEEDNEWYYNFIKLWNNKSGVPILLNTSFNDRSPIVETPEHAVDCFVGTNIDGLYFYDFGILVLKEQNK